jgi:hypothetical protein
MTDTATEAVGEALDVSGHGPLAGVRVIELGMLLAGPFEQAVNRVREFGDGQIHRLRMTTKASTGLACTVDS